MATTLGGEWVDVPNGYESDRIAQSLYVYDFVEVRIVRDRCCDQIQITAAGMEYLRRTGVVDESRSLREHAARDKRERDE